MLEAGLNIYQLVCVAYLAKSIGDIGGGILEIDESSWKKKVEGRLLDKFWYCRITRGSLMNVLLS